MEQEKQKKDNFFKRAFKDMVESAKAQHAVDKANFEAVKAESRANFEENRGSNTFKRAKKNARKSWNDAKMTPAERTAKTREEQLRQIEEAHARKIEAEKRLEEARVKKNN